MNTHDLNAVPPQPSLLTCAAGRIAAVLLLIGAIGAPPLVRAQPPAHELHIHGETPVPERMKVWADEAVRPLQLDDLQQGPAGIHLALDRPGYVTLIIETAAGVRVRNLVSERFFEAGEHWWGGYLLARDTASTNALFARWQSLATPAATAVWLLTLAKTARSVMCPPVRTTTATGNEITVLV